MASVNSFIRKLIPHSELVGADRKGDRAFRKIKFLLERNGTRLWIHGYMKCEDESVQKTIERWGKESPHFMVFLKNSTQGDYLDRIVYNGKEFVNLQGYVNGGLAYTTLDDGKAYFMGLNETFLSSSVKRMVIRDDTQYSDTPMPSQFETPFGFCVTANCKNLELKQNFFKVATPEQLSAMDLIQRSATSASDYQIALLTEQYFKHSIPPALQSIFPQSQRTQSVYSQTTPVIPNICPRQLHETDNFQFKCDASDSEQNWTQKPSSIKRANKRIMGLLKPLIGSLHIHVEVSRPSGKKLTSITRQITNTSVIDLPISQKPVSSKFAQTSQSADSQMPLENSESKNPTNSGKLKDNRSTRNKQNKKPQEKESVENRKKTGSKGKSASGSKKPKAFEPLTYGYLKQLASNRRLPAKRPKPRNRKPKAIRVRRSGQAELRALTSPFFFRKEKRSRVNPKKETLHLNSVSTNILLQRNKKRSQKSPASPQTLVRKRKRIQIHKIKIQPHKIHALAPKKPQKHQKKNISRGKTILSKKRKSKKIILFPNSLFRSKSRKKRDLELIVKEIFRDAA